MAEPKILRLEIGLQGPNTQGASGFVAKQKKAIREGFETLDQLSRLLSKRNISLLRLIRKSKPQSVAELARLSGRPKSSLTLTLRRLEKFGFVSFRKIGNGRVVPMVSCDRLMLEVALVTPSEG